MKSRSPKPNKLVLSDINPDNGSKFSPNLFKFLSASRNKIQALYAQVWVDADGVLYLGWRDEAKSFFGCQLMQVLCNGTRTQTWCIERLKLKLLNNFWEEYLRIGRCAIDTAHAMPFAVNNPNVSLDSERWDEKPTVRTCRWCGHKQKKQITFVKVKKIDWVNVP